MPGRKLPLITEEIYHVFNRGINHQPTFKIKKELNRAIQTMLFYRFETIPIKFSKFLVFNEERRSQILENMQNGKKLVDIIAFCMMPNHFHFLLKQKRDNGISSFLGNFQNSYTRYSNVKNNRDGALFLNQFKAVRVETNDQLLHISRYIHLNPHTGFIVKSIDELEDYPWSSFPIYMKNNKKDIDSGIVLDQFKNAKDYKRFIFDQADYQRELKKIEHMLFENS